MFELMRGDHTRARTNVSELARIVRDYDLPLLRAFAEFLGGWATADAGSSADGLDSMHRGVDSLRAQNILTFDGLLKIALAEVEARAGDPGRAAAILDEALATADRLSYRTFEAELHRVRGQVLLKSRSRQPRARARRIPDRQSRSRSSKGRAASNCARHWRSPSSINRPAVQSRPTPSSRPRSKALRRRRKCPRSPRRRKCWLQSRPAHICDRGVDKAHLNARNRPSETSTVAIWNVRVTSTPATSAPALRLVPPV